MNTTKFLLSIAIVLMSTNTLADLEKKETPEAEKPLLKPESNSQEAPPKIEGSKPQENTAIDAVSQAKDINEKATKFLLNFTGIATNIISAYKEADDRTRLSEQYKKIKSITDPNDLYANLKISTPQLVEELKDITNSPEFLEQSKKVSAENIALIKSSMLGFMISTLQLKKLLDSGKTLTSSMTPNNVANPEIMRASQNLLLATNAMSSLMTAMPKLINLKAQQ